MSSQTPTPETFLPLRPGEFEILLALPEGDHHGYAIIREAESRSAGGMKLETGTLYRAIRRLTAAPSAGR
jgi:DNA-binding PadR family transcriptional regulator